jgi:hypothetical protein
MDICFSIGTTKVKHGELNAEDNGTKQLNQHGRETTYLYKIVRENRQMGYL